MIILIVSNVISLLSVCILGISRDKIREGVRDCWEGFMVGEEGVGHEKSDRGGDEV